MTTGGNCTNMDIDDLFSACQCGDNEKMENILAKGKVDDNGRNTQVDLIPLMLYIYGQSGL
jgi:hypothetical protein